MKISQRIGRLADAMPGALRHMGEAYAGIAAAGVGGAGAVAASKEGIVGDHFRHGNAARYGWPPLTGKYAKWKAKRFPNRPQNVLTGRLKHSVLGRGTIRVHGGNRVSVLWRVPSYAAVLIKQGRHPVAPDAADRKEIAEAGRRYMQMQIKRLRLSATTRV